MPGAPARIPGGAALVAAAVDCRRAGLHEPQPLGLLAELAEQYLSRCGGPLLRPEPLEDALAWAIARSHGASSLLLPTSRDACYLAFDYLIDLGGLDGVPQSTWKTLIDHATGQQAFDIGESAMQRFQHATAVMAYRKAADHGIPDADVAMASASVGTAGNNELAVQTLVDALVPHQGTLAL